MSQRSPTRRRIVRLAGIGALTGLAGCTGGAPSGDEPGTDTPTPESTPEPTPTPEPTATETEELTPHSPESVHYHGTMVVTINGETYHLGDEPRNMMEQTGVEHFHFHDDGERDRWHVHSQDVTVGFALGTMPEVELDGDTFTFRGHTYDATADGTEVAVTANGEEIEAPSQYVLQEGDEIEITVETDAEAPTPGTEEDDASTPD